MKVFKAMHVPHCIFQRRQQYPIEQSFKETRVALAIFSLEQWGEQWCEMHPYYEEEVEDKDAGRAMAELGAGAFGTTYHMQSLDG